MKGRLKDPVPQMQAPSNGGPPTELSQPELPAELIQALTVEPDPYLLLGREYARRIKLENVVEQTLTFLKREKGKVDGS